MMCGRRAGRPVAGRRASRRQARGLVGMSKYENPAAGGS
jgi:hypothetical protein